MSEKNVLKLRILVVDDEPMICDCIVGLLTYGGHQVESVNSGEAALALIEKGKFDLVFTDYSMPGMQGDVLAIAIKALAPDQRIIMVTGHAPNCESLPGIDLIISKPVMLDDLCEAIDRLFGERSFAE
jgi:CheY-like chemotaxis protein